MRRARRTGDVGSCWEVVSNGVGSEKGGVFVVSPVEVSLEV